MKHKLLCLTCKNKGCVARCRFVYLQPARKNSGIKNEGAK
jgi:hypothetical protein